MSFTKLRNILKTGDEQTALNMWNDAFNSGDSGAQQLPAEWIKHLMDISRTGMGIQQQPAAAPQPAQQPVQQPAPVAERLSTALIRPRKPIVELSSDKLGQYKKAAGAQASAADKAGNTKKADKRFSGIVKATKKQFANDAKGVAENSEAGREIAYQGYKIKFTPAELIILRGGDVALTRPGNFSNPTKQQLSVAKRYIDQMWQKDKEKKQSPNISQQHDLYGATQEYKKLKQEISQYLEPFNKERIALVISTRGDSLAWRTGLDALHKKYHGSTEFKELQARNTKILAKLNQLKKTNSWVDKQSATEGLGSKLAGLGLAGAMALGAGGANARVTPDGQGGYTGGFKPAASQQAPDSTPNKAEAPKGFSKEYLQKAADPNRFGRYLISVEKAQELLSKMNAVDEAKKKGADGKACWKGYRYAGTENGKDKCVPVSEDVENIMGALIENLIRK
jgi:hypothetical protein